ncbi:MAG: sensor histidine kinase, partial [Calditrichaeota bacterium]|nr:sensor histidine kinase [Calditrichota bacterium]
NLLDNALRYTPAGGRVTVRLIQQQRKIMVQVSDTGCGIAREELPLIFDRFYRV